MLLLRSNRSVCCQHKYYIVQKMVRRDLFTNDIEVGRAVEVEADVPSDTWLGLMTEVAGKVCMKLSVFEKGNGDGS